VQQAYSGLGRLTFVISRLHTQKHSVGLLCTWDRPIAETYTWQNNPRDRHPCPRRDSNPQFQQASGPRTTP